MSNRAMREIPSDRLTVCWSLTDCARAIAALQAEGLLARRTILVPTERVAHALRREILRSGLGSALAGTRFVPVLAAAVAVLHGAEIDFEPGEEALRRARLLALFEQGLALRHFPLGLLRERPGWDEAFARTIGDLEWADLRPEDLDRHAADARIADVAAIWRALHEAAGRSWTAAQIYQSTALVLESQPDVWVFEGATLGVVADVSAAQARFLRAVPSLALGLLVARPVRQRQLDRAALLLGPTVVRALREASAPRSAGSERDLLASYLFESSQVSRPPGAGPDGSVDLEQHAGVEEEVEATSQWVARCVGQGTALEDIAVLVPALDPLANLVVGRLARLPWAEGALPVRVAGGTPLTASAAGARALAVVRGLRAHLAGEALAALLPALRTGDERGHLAHGAATDLVWALGTVGGNPARREGALDWAPRAAERETTLQAQLARAVAAGDDDPDKPSLARRQRDLERLLADIRAVRPAINGLVDVARAVVGGASLADLWAALRGFVGEWLLQPGGGSRVQALLDERLAPLTAGVGAALTGDKALGVIEDVISTARVSTGRFGEPAVYVGTVAGAVGLSFAAVRIVGLAEGHLPSVPREDPVLPDAVRVALSPTLVTAADRVLTDLHALDIALRNARGRVALSAPRVDVERSVREPSFVLLEAATALGRPNAISGEAARAVPDSAALERDAFVPARHAALDHRRREPVSEAAWQDAVALGAVGVPPRWRRDIALDLARVEALLRSDAAGAMDGLLGVAEISVPGLTAERPISPSRLEVLLGCPHRFLFETLLRFEEPAAAPALREVGQPAYGGLFHLAAERLYREHGAAIVAGDGTREAWVARAAAVADEVFATFLDEYPLVGDAVRAGQRRRLRRDLQELVRYDWRQGGGRRFVAAERGFGRPEGVRLETAAGPLFVTGRIDRIDVEGNRTLVRDLKTGKAHRRVGKEREADHGLDVQLAIYGLVASALAAEWGVPASVGVAYAYFGRGLAAERDWRADFDTSLGPAARGWLGTAASLLSERTFPRTSDPDDCEWCPFQPVCGDDVYARAARLLRGATGGLGALAVLKRVPPVAP
jgi:RecB family exonuclease